MNSIAALSAEKKFDCKVIVVSNCKGGTGKSTTAINLGIGLANKGYRVLLVDNDPQGSMSLGLGIDNPDMLDYSLATALVKMITGEQINPREGIVRHEEGVDLMPGNIELCGLEVELVEKGIKEALRKYLSFHKNDYDYIIVDCQPSLSQLTLNAFAAADSIIVPVQASYLPVKGLEQFISAVNMAATRPAASKVKLIDAKSRSGQYGYLLKVAADCETETAVLYRDNEFALPLIDRLDRESIPFRIKSVDMAFFTHRIVSDVTAFLRFALNPYDTELFMKLYYKLQLYLKKPQAERMCLLSSMNQVRVPDAAEDMPELNGKVVGNCRSLSSHLKNMLNICFYILLASSLCRRKQLPQ